MKDPDENVPHREPAGKRPYAKPVLRTYGAIRLITESLSNMGQLDGASPPMRKS